MKLSIQKLLLGEKRLTEGHATYTKIVFVFLECNLRGPKSRIVLIFLLFLFAKIFFF